MKIVISENSNIFYFTFHNISCITIRYLQKEGTRAELSNIKSIIRTVNEAAKNNNKLNQVNVGDDVSIENGELTLSRGGKVRAIITPTQSLE